MVLNPRTIAQYLFKLANATSHWHRTTHNFVILSPIFERSNIFELLKIFSMNVWLTIIITMLLLTPIVNIVTRLDRSYRISRINMLDTLFEILKYILHECSSNWHKKNIVIGVWSLACLVLTACFSGGILRFIVNRRHTTIDSIDELVQHNWTIVTDEFSWLNWQNKAAKDLKRNASLDHNLNAIRIKLNSSRRNNLKMR